MGKIKKFFQKTGVALAVLACTVIGAIKLSPELTNPGMFSQVMTIAAGLVGVGAVMIGCGIGKAVQSSKEKKMLSEINGEPQLESPKQTVNGMFNGQGANGYQNSGTFGQRIGEKVEQGVNKLGIEMGKLFGNNNRPNTSANPYSSTVNHGANPYSSRDRMSAGYGGTYNGQTYNSSMTGDVRDAQRTGQQGGYYSGNNQYNNRQGGYNANQNGYQANQGGYNTNNANRGYNNQGGYRNGQNGNSYNYNQNQNVQYGGNNNRPNTGNYNQNVQYGGANNRPNNGGYNPNVQYGNYQNGGQNQRPAPNTSGLEESAKSNYFENEPGSSSYRSGPLKK